MKKKNMAILLLWWQAKKKPLSLLGGWDMHSAQGPFISFLPSFLSDLSAAAAMPRIFFLPQPKKCCLKKKRYCPAMQRERVHHPKVYYRSQVHKLQPKAPSLQMTQQQQQQQRLLSPVIMADNTCCCAVTCAASSISTLSGNTSTYTRA